MEIQNGPNTNLEKIKRISGVLSIVSAIFMYLIIASIAVVILGIIFLHSPDVQVKINTLEMALSDLTPGAKSIVILIAILAGVILVLVFYHLRKLFSLYREGEIFTEGTVKEIRNLGFLLIFWAIFDFIFAFAEILLSSMLKADGAADVVFNPSGFGMPLFVGFVVLIVARIMDEGRRLKEDIDLTI